MKALIFNSGVGKRMGEMTKNSPKSLVKLLNGETLFERQIRILSECGVKEFVITTGPYEDQLINITKKNIYRKLTFHFVHNDVYDTTNYIYSCYLARDYLNDDFLTLHGDLVFNKKLVQEMLNNPTPSLCLINKCIPLPDKDFKGRIIDGKLREVGINIFENNCFTFQPLYKLSKKDLNTWLDSIVDYIENKKIFTVYAENAFNDVSESMDVIPMSYSDFYINEIDNIDDYARVTKDIQLVDYKEQEFHFGIESLNNILNNYDLRHPLVVLGQFLMNSWVTDFISSISNVVYFTSFKANPLYEDVINGVSIFKENNCDSIISIGGGSAIDTAKAIKLFLPLDEKKNFLKQNHEYINLKHIAIPTTAGTGSESTRFAVIYYKGIKQSLCNDCILPDVAILEEKFLRTLPLYQRKATIFDALCQAIESMWSVNSTIDSITNSKEAIKLILSNLNDYLAEKEDSIPPIQRGSNLAGKAINISQTTAAHAMSYKLTSLYGIAHGHAVAVCMPYVWKYLADNANKTTDQRGKSHVKDILEQINALFGTKSSDESINKFTSLLDRYEMIISISNYESQLDLLVNSVNLIRLKNYPVQLTENEIREMYVKILK